MPRKTEPKIMLDLEPFSEYLKRRLLLYGSRGKLAEAIGISTRKLDTYMDGIIAEGSRKGQPITKVEAGDVDKCTIKLGDHAIIDGEYDNPTLILIT